MRIALLILVFFLSQVLPYAGQVKGAEQPAPRKEASGWTTAHFPVPVGLKQLGDPLSGPVNADTSGSQKNYHPSFFHGRDLYLRSLISGYLAFSRTICISLPISRIIFPFHDFG